MKKRASIFGVAAILALAAWVSPTVGASTTTAPRISIQALADQLVANASRTPSRYPGAPKPYTLNFGL